MHDDRPAPRTRNATADAGLPRRDVSVWLAGRIGVDAYGAMAERLAWEVSEPDGRPPTLLLYEPEPAVTIGRLGSRVDVDLSAEELRSRRLEVRFVGRGGGAVLHGPGQIGVALFAALADLGLGPHAAGVAVDRLEDGLAGAIRGLRCGAARDSRVHGVFGRTGLLAAVGVAVRRGILWHGGFLNVQPAIELQRRVKTVPFAAGVAVRTMGTVEADVQRRIRLQDARSLLVEQIVDACGFPQSHVQSGFPVPVPSSTPSAERVSRVG
jgi:lipoyl(octanoyl) transferase